MSADMKLDTVACTHPEGDVTGEIESRKVFDDFLAQSKALIGQIFSHPALLRERDLLDILADEMHESVDNALTELYAKDSDDGLDVSDIDEVEDVEDKNGD